VEIAMAKKVDLTATMVPVAPGSKIELFRVYHVGHEGIRVEIQGFTSPDPSEMGAILARVADVVSDAMVKVIPPDENGERSPRDAILSVIVGSMVAMLVQPIPGEEIQETYMEAPFRGEPSKKGH
jgi:hypothetical protein